MKAICVIAVFLFSQLALAKPAPRKAIEWEKITKVIFSYEPVQKLAQDRFIDSLGRTMIGEDEVYKLDFVDGCSVLLKVDVDLEHEVLYGSIRYQVDKHKAKSCS